MANLNYDRRLMNLSARRFDEDIQRSDLSESYGKSILPKNLEYLIESMRPIGKKYNDVTLTAAANVEKHLEQSLNLTFNRAYRKQGSVTTNTNIKLHSDIDLLAVINGYQYQEPALHPILTPYTGEPHNDITELRKQSTEIMKGKYDEVDTSGTKCISIYNKNLKRKVDVVFSFWYDTKEFINSGNEYYRGIYLFNFPIKLKELDYPFAHIRNVNWKATETRDGSCKGIRLIKTLRADSDKRIVLTSFELTSLVYEIDNQNLFYQSHDELKIAISISAQIVRMLSNETYRKGIKSPNGIESPFKDDKCLTGLRNLKEDLDQLIMDCGGELNNYLTKRSLLLY
ncbi:hypothetical protein [Dyadobacter sp. NIV53]|uniref:hypothetical protein n=1 Tax=Dyadobacter sp. NIV53 TaxID=2861765 RepID=UPI001C888968|nr:hypothetical protein [Dyadobacter sp. NIV53]